MASAHPRRPTQADRSGAVSVSPAKRQKEQRRREQKREKDERRRQRREESKDRGERSGNVDPDIAGIVPGPQPPADDSAY
jgi:hypothetical protein